MLKAALLSLVLSCPSFSHAPATLRINVRVKNPTAEALAVVLDGDFYYRSSIQALEPNRTAYQFEFRDVPAGVYELVSAVSDRAGKILEQQQREVTVLE